MAIRTFICPDARRAGELAGAIAAAALAETLARKERARLLLSTGASQFETLRALVRRPIAWERVDGFHLDEYIGLDPEHPASFRRYLHERVGQLVPLSMHYVEPEHPTRLAELAEVVSASPMDVALIGVGENGHLAFNDPPADFDATEPYLTVTLDATCRAQQVGEGWFTGPEEVPTQAISMSVHEIMRSRRIVSAVPHAVKAPVIARLLSSDEVTPDLPASMLHRHTDAQLITDAEGAQRLPKEVYEQCIVL